MTIIKILIRSVFVAIHRARLVIITLRLIHRSFRDLLDFLIKDVQELVILIPVHVELIVLLGELNVLLGEKGVAELGGTELVVVLELHLEVCEKAWNAAEIVRIRVERLMWATNCSVKFLVMT